MFYYVTERINSIYNLFSTLKLKLHLYSTFNKTLLVLMALNFTINYANALQVVLNMLIDSLTFKCSFFPLHLVYNSSRFKKKIFAKVQYTCTSMFLFWNSVSGPVNWHNCYNDRH